MTTSQGILHYHVEDREPTITLDTEASLTADYDNYSLFLGGTEVAFSAAFAISGHTLTIAAPKVQRVGVTDGERGNKRVDELKLQCNASSGDDELTFTYV